MPTRVVGGGSASKGRQQPASSRRRRGPSVAPAAWRPWVCGSAAPELPLQPPAAAILPSCGQCPLAAHPSALLYDLFLYALSQAERHTSFARPMLLPRVQPGHQRTPLATSPHPRTHTGVYPSFLPPHISFLCCATIPCCPHSAFCCNALLCRPPRKPWRPPTEQHFDCDVAREIWQSYLKLG